MKGEQARAIAIQKVRQLGYKISDNGIMLCPFHDDHKPSAHIYANQYHDWQIEFHCFGCGKNYKFETFLKLLTGEEKEEEKQEEKGQRTIQSIYEELFQRFMVLQALRRREVETELLSEQHAGEEALKYLASRGFNEDEVMRFGIAFATRELLLGIEEFKNLSFLKNPERKCFLVYPIRNKEGRVVSLQFEDFQNREKLENTKFNLQGKTLPLCYLSEYSPKAIYIVCEGFLDALSVEILGVEQFKTVALLGTPSQAQIEELKELASTNEIFFAFDNDKTGRAFQEKLFKELIYINPYIKKITIPKEIKDLNELLVKKGKAGIIEAITSEQNLMPIGTIRERIPEILNNYLKAKQNSAPIPKKLSFLQSLFPDGLLPGLYAVAGMPGVGKTTFLNLLCDELAKQGYKSFYFLTEEPLYRLLSRTAKREGKAHLDELMEFEWLENRRAPEVVFRFDIEDLRSYMEALLRGEGRAILVLDSLHALNVGREKMELRKEVIFKTELLAHISRDLTIPVFFTSFIPKDSYKVDNPDVGIFKEAGEIEYLIDVGLVLTPKEEKDTKRRVVRLTAVKNRLGKVGSIDLVFHVDKFDFEEYKG